MLRLTRFCVRNARLPASSMQQRSISVLFVSSDKANENHAPLRPYMDFQNTLMNMEALKENIAHRQLLIDVDLILANYKKYQDVLGRLRQLDEKRKDIALEIRKSSSDGSETNLDDLREKGKQLKIEYKEVKAEFSVIENDFIQGFLSLPNALHTDCPVGHTEKVVFMSTIPKIEESETHLKRTNLIKFLNNSCYYMMEEAAEFEVNCTHALTNHFNFNCGFLETANPDFVRRVLLEANATPVEIYHVVEERHLENKLNSAFFAGGASFESFLGAVAKLRIGPHVLPLRFVSCGRIYEKVSSDPKSSQANLFTATQSNAVSTFVASSTACEADEHMHNILNIAMDFYKELGVHFRVIYAPSCKLTAAEKLRALIEIYSPAEKRYICVGHVSNYGDYVSKRLLFAVQNKKCYSFPHLVGGPVLFTTRLIATLIENKISLANVKLLGAYKDFNWDDAADDIKQS